MHNDSLVSIGQFNVRRRAFKTARKIRELVVFSFCKEINLFQVIMDLCVRLAQMWTRIDNFGKMTLT